MKRAASTTAAAAIETNSAVTNSAVEFYRQILFNRRPRPIEPQRYMSPAHAFTTLRKASHLSQAQMAFRLGISLPQLEKIEAGSHGGNAQLGTIDRAMELAKGFALHGVHDFLNKFRNEVKRHPKRGPKTSQLWYVNEDDNDRDGDSNGRRIGF